MVGGLGRRLGLVWACVLVCATAAIVAGQHHRPRGISFRPEGYHYLVDFGDGRGPNPLDVFLHLTQVSVATDVCEGLNDVIAVTLLAPITGGFTPDDFVFRACPDGWARPRQEVQHSAIEVDDDASHSRTSPKLPLAADFELCHSVTPKCAHLQLDDVPTERRTLLLFGDFLKPAGPLPVTPASDWDVFVTMRSVTFLLDGNQIARYGSNWYFHSGQAFNGFAGMFSKLSDLPTPAQLGYGEGPFLADAAFHNLSAPVNTASADPNGCAARHPSATYAVRLLFASAVHERAADGSLTPFGTNATAAAALFSVCLGTGYKDLRWSPDRVVGVAGAPGGSVVDVCIEAAAGVPQVEAVFIQCTETAPLSPAGFWSYEDYKFIESTVAYLRSYTDQALQRDPAEVANFAHGHSIEFCLSTIGDCPGAPWTPPSGAVLFQVFASAALLLAIAAVLVAVGHAGCV